jgi:colanic acid/amylovoran biosynthesis glycosyltransferase
MNPLNSKQYNVLQSTPCWLPQTMVWLYEQVINLSPSFISHIVCEETKNLEQFNIQHLYCKKHVSKFAKLQKNIALSLDLAPFNFYLEKIAKNTEASLIHSHFGDVAWMNSRTALRLKLPHIASFYGYDVSLLPKSHPKWKKLYSNLFSNIDIVLALGQNMSSELEYLGCHKKKIIIHHLGIDLSNLPFHPRQWDISQPFRVLIAASFREKKGIPFALEALSKVKEYANLEITIIGDATPEERSRKEKEQIMNVVQRLKLGPIVKFLGYQPYKVFIEESYKNHLFLSPSITASDGDTEGTPITIAEMAATGMPIISTFHADIPEIIRHNETGWLAKEKDTEELASYIHSLIKNPEMWGAFLKAGRQHIENEFDVKKQSVKLAEIYKKLL